MVIGIPFSKCANGKGRYSMNIVITREPIEGFTREIDCHSMHELSKRFRLTKYEQEELLKTGKVKKRYYPVYTEGCMIIELKGE